MHIAKEVGDTKATLKGRRATPLHQPLLYTPVMGRTCYTCRYFAIIFCSGALPNAMWCNPFPFYEELIVCNRIRYFDIVQHEVCILPNPWQDNTPLHDDTSLIQHYTTDIYALHSISSPLPSSHCIRIELLSHYDAPKARDLEFTKRFFYSECLYLYMEALVIIYAPQQRVQIDF